jgi:ABC-type nitrate/sulfonate/bicarbonate transport system substrate-binding protein
MTRIIATFDGRARARTVRCAIVAIAAGVLLAACGSSGSDKTAAVSSGKSLPVFTLGQTLVSPTSSDLWVALAKGYFTKAGVNVKVEVQGATATTNAAAGHTDIVQSGVTASFAPTAAGHAQKIIYEVSPGLSTTGIVVAANSPIKSIMDMSGKSVTVLGVGTSTYGAATAYSNYIVKHGGKPLKIIAASQSSQQTSDVVSGEADGSVGLLDIFAPAITAGKIRILVNPSSALARSLFPSTVVNIGYWGLASNLASNKQATTAFVAGLRQADTWLRHATPAQIAATLKQTQFFDQYSVQQIEAMLPYDIPFFSTTDGFISQANWSASLKEFGTWGISNIDLTSPMFSYGSIVDMSYWQSASALINS